MRSPAEQAEEILRRINPGRIHQGQPVGLRDSALLALVAAGLSAADIASLKASDIDNTGGQVIVTVVVRTAGSETRTLSHPFGARVLAWLRERRLWGTAAPVFTTTRGKPYTARGITAVLDRYRRPKKKPSRRKTIILNPVELVTLWEGRGGRRPLTLQAIAARLGASEPTVRRRLKALRASGQASDAVRARAVATLRGAQPGIRPRNPLHDAALRAVWSRTANLAATASHLHVSRSRVRARLEELGLLKIKRRRRRAPRRAEDVH